MKSASFAFGEVCYSSEQLKTWFVVKRILGDPTVFCDACPHGTETSIPLVQARLRLNAYAADTEKKIMDALQRPARRFGMPRQ
jgi:hypothetical protein